MRSPPETAQASNARWWLVAFLVLQFACQLALLVEFLAPARIVFRTAAFTASLVALFAVPGASRRHPSRWLAAAALAIVGANLFHPNTNSPLAGVAHVALYAAIIGPLFWVNRLTVTPKTVAIVLAVVWGFHTISAAVGVLQVYFPGQFQPTVSSVVLSQEEMVESYKIELPDGSRIWRPMGLTDIPGGASAAGLYAVLFGLGFVAVSRQWWVRGAGVAGMSVGLFCIYLCQVRAAVVVVGIAAIAFLGLLALLGRFRELTRAAVTLPAVVVGGFAWAFVVGGGVVTSRLETLIEDQPYNVYYANRGKFVEDTFTTLLPEHPFGAGLGRWGMTRGYFGDETNPMSTAIWAEVQWTAWAIDGGWPLMAAYALAAVVAVWATVYAARRTRDRWLAGWAVLVFSYAVAVCAMTFSYVPFIGQAGMEFWFLNALIWAAVTRRPDDDA